MVRAKMKDGNKKGLDDFILNYIDKQNNSEDF
jgi:hypothetical protein